MNEWSCTYTVLFVYFSQCLIQHNSAFTFTWKRKSPIHIMVQVICETVDSSPHVHEIPSRCGTLNFTLSSQQKHTGLLDCLLSTYKGKTVPLQAWSGPEGSRKLRFPDFTTTAQDGGKVVSLTHRPPLPPRKCFWYSFLLEAESTPGP